MKLTLRSILATCLLASFNEAPYFFDSPTRADAASQRSSDADNADDFKLYVGQEARWLVDLRLGVVSAWELERDVPLWSRDGVVFRVERRPNDVFADFKRASSQTPRAATEIFGRVYFFLDDILVALDPRAEGRLVWKRTADDFARFFSAPNSDDATFLVPKIDSTSNDRLLIEARRGQESKRFIIDAASGEFNLARSAETPNL